MTSPRIPPPGLIEHAPRHILLLQLDFPEHPATLQGYALRPAEAWVELREHARTAPPSSVVLVRTRGAPNEVGELEDLIHETPSVPVVAAVEFGRVDAGRVRAVLATGVAEILNLDGVRGLEAIVPTLWMPADARTLLRAAAETVVDHGGRDVFAGIFGVYARTLSARCTDLHLPAPRQLLGWMRVLLALTVLEEAGRTVMNVALSCGYNDNSALKRAIENLVGAPASGSIRDQRFEPAFDDFLEELRALRHGSPARRSGAAA
ncbi:MAG TPA: helix-turn-helix domain-containing protein [Longimicrobium sp.]|nr:helix-turn-helix domain-containing protein [Longimicrobium sp.]